MPSPKIHQKIERLNTAPRTIHFVMQKATAEGTKPKLASLFSAFGHKVNVRFDREFLYVESNGMPDHPMMTGITAWQQVPIPQAYTGNNAWKIPLHPVPAQNPMSTKNISFAAIALAVNGVPIFNPIKNNGKTDTLLAGEPTGGVGIVVGPTTNTTSPSTSGKIVGREPCCCARWVCNLWLQRSKRIPTDLDWLNGHKDLMNVSLPRHKNISLFKRWLLW